MAPVSNRRSRGDWRRRWRTSPPGTEDSLKARARLARLLMSAVVLVTVLVIPPMPSGSFLAVSSPPPSLLPINKMAVCHPRPSA
jgi:hypothetical protein